MAKAPELPSTSPTPARAEAMGGLAKGLRIIESFDETHPTLTVSTAAKAAGITPAAARRCLLTMHELGYLSYDGKFFGPTPRMARLVRSYSATAPLSVLAQPYLQAVRDELGESASLAVLDGDQVTFVARVESERIVTMNVRLGGHLPSYASSTGRVLLAALPDEEIDRELSGRVPERTTPRTLTSIPEIRARILAAREPASRSPTRNSSWASARSPSPLSTRSAAPMPHSALPWRQGGPRWTSCASATSR